LTTFDTVNDIFFKRVQKDSDFFEYTNVTEAEALELAKINAFDYMIDGVATILEHSAPDVDFNDYDEVLSRFNFDMTNSEIQMLVGLMFEKFLMRDIAQLKIYSKHFTTNEIKLFSPAEERKTFISMVNGVIAKNVRTIKSHDSRDRLTNQWKSYSGAKLWH